MTTVDLGSTAQPEPTVPSASGLAPAPGVTCEAAAAPAPIAAIDRALQILTELSSAQVDGLALSEIARRLGINKSTVYRALVTLKGREYVVQDPFDGTYSLGPAAVSLGQRYFAEGSLSVVLHPALLALGQEVNELVHLGMLSSTSVLYLDRVEPERFIRVRSQVGQRIPAIITAMGRAMLAAGGIERDQLSAYLQAMGPHPRVSADYLWRLIESARERGYALDLEDNEPGVSCFGVALLSGGRPVAALSITVLAPTLDRRREDDFRRAVRRVVAPALPAVFRLPDEL